MKVFDFVKELIEKIESGIRKVESFKNLTGKEKMDKLNDIVYYYYDTNFDKIQMNPLIRIFLKGKIRKVIPYLTQKVYDLISTHIEGITKKNS